MSPIGEPEQVSATLPAPDTEPAPEPRRLEVIGPRVIIKPVPPPDRDSPLLLPATVRESERRGIVLAVGSRKGKHGQEIPLDVLPGAIVRYQHGGQWLDLDGEPLMFVPYDDVFAVEVPDLPA